jgi:hypothetical protein
VKYCGCGAPVHRRKWLISPFFLYLRKGRAAAAGDTHVPQTRSPQNVKYFIADTTVTIQRWAADQSIFGDFDDDLQAPAFGRR